MEKSNDSDPFNPLDTKYVGYASNTPYESL